MSKLTIYRYDNECFAVGQEIGPRGDSYNILTVPQKKVEEEIRAILPNGAHVRSSSLYVWEDEAVARRVWPRSKKKYLYKLEIENSNVRLKADLNCYSQAQSSPHFENYQRIQWLMRSLP